MCTSPDDPDDILSYLIILDLMSSLENTIMVDDDSSKIDPTYLQSGSDLMRSTRQKTMTVRDDGMHVEPVSKSIIIKIQYYRQKTWYHLDTCDIVVYRLLRLLIRGGMLLN